MTRRDLFAAALAAPLVRAAAAKIPIGITDWNLRLSANPEAIPLAARLGFDGIQISVGRRLVDDKLPLDNPEVVARCLALSKQHKIPIHRHLRRSTTRQRPQERSAGGPLGSRFHTPHPGCRYPRAAAAVLWKMGAPDAAQEMEYTGDALRDLAPEAEKANVILGLENTISAEDNVRIMDRARSKMFWSTTMSVTPPTTALTW